jgi:RHS repeat-associated protein
MKRSLWCVVAILSLRCLSFAQDSPNLEIGLKPYGSYQAGKIDVVNLENGNVSLYQILRHIPQRGGKLDLDYYFRYNNKSYTVDSNCDPLAGCNPTWVLSETNDLGAADTVAAGVEVTQNFVASRSGQAVLNGCDQASNTCWYDHISTVALVDGGSHTMGNFPHAGYDNAPAGFDVFNGARSLDGTGLYASSDGTVTLSNGVRLYTPYMTSLSGVYLEDPNGNRILWTMTPGTVVQTFTDTLGRTLPGLPTSLSDPYTTTYSGLPTTSDFSGCTGPRQIQSARVMNFPAYGGGSTPAVIKLCFVQIALQTNFGAALGAIEFTGTRWFLQSIVLPDSTAWTFEYDSRSPGDPTTVNYGDLTKVTLPTGGTISYSWQNLPPGAQAGYASVSRAVSTRTLNANDGTGDHTWTYQFSDITISPYTDTVTEPVVPPASTGAKSIHSFEGGYETQSQEFDSSGNLLKTIQTQFTGFSTAVGRVLGSASVPVVIKTTLSNGLVSEVDKSYLGINSTGANSSFSLEFLGVNYTNPMGSPTDEYIYDYGGGQHGPLLRHTHIDYEFQTNPNFLTLNLMSSVHDQITYDGAGGQVAETTYGYDESGLGSSGVSTQFNSSPINGTTRGNQTSVQRWLNTTNSSITSTATYFNTGSLQSSTDPLLHATTHSYDTFYAGAYPTMTCAPLTAGIAHCVSGTYDFDTGVLTSLSNENASAQAVGNTPGDSAHTTTYQYDSMLRIKNATGPQDPGNANASSVTSFQYSTNAPFSVQRQTSVTTSLTDTFSAYFDGVGRQYQTQHFTPGCTAVTDTAYDTVGRVSSVSNPYCLGSSHLSDPTYGITQTSHDGIGRVTQITEQDGSISGISYDVAAPGSAGNCVVATDEANHLRRSCTDALGRLVEVDEPFVGTLPAQSDYATMQTDGNFVLYNPTGTALWATGTAGSGGSSIEIQDDGNFVLYIEKWQAGTYATPSPGPFPTQTCSIGSALNAPQTLASGQCIVSPHGQYMLYMASNGNFYIYDIAHNVATWSANTYNHPGAYAVMQGDGNFCVYAADGTFLWMSGTNGTFAERLEMEDDGRIMIFRSAWSSGTSQGWSTTNIAHPACDAGTGTGWTGVLGTGQCYVSPNGRYDVIMQTDGNLVLYDRASTPAPALWSTGTAVNALSPGVALQTLYFYDALGNLNCVEQHGGVSGTGCSAAPSSDATSPWRVRRFTYDSLSRLLTAHNPESGTISYSYDADGNLLQKTSPAPNQTGSATQTISYCYDELHRVTGKAWSAQSCPLASPVVTYTYDSGANAKGKLSGVTDQAGTASYSYDVLGRLFSETRVIAGVPKSISYEYNLDGSLKTLHYPSGRTVTYTPDSAGRIVSAADGNGTQYVTSATFYASGAEYQRNMPGIYFRNDLNPRLQVSGFYSDNGQTSSFFMNKSYNYGAAHQNNGNVISIVNNKDSSRTQTFAYDALNRITSGSSAAATGALSWGENYSIDPWGNLMISPMGGKAHGGNFQHAGNVNNQATGLGYDAAGNLTNYTAPGQYVYDPENRIQSTAGVTYIYDADGNRVEKSGGTSSTLYWYGAPGIIAESDLSGTLKSEYVFFNGKRLARIDLPSGTVHYYLSDHLNSTSMVINGAGAVEDESDYSSFGTEYQITTGSNHYKFTGKERDGESGLDYFGARHYSSGLGRFITPDWSAKVEPVPYSKLDNPQTLNLYSYVLNNPLGNIDTDGHACVALYGNNSSGFCQRATEYGKIDAISGVQSKTRFFAAANAVSQALADVATPISGLLVSKQTANFLEGVGQKLEKLNQAEASAIQNGSLKGSNLDQQLVHTEQSAVQGQLDSLKQSDAAAYSKTITEINGSLNGLVTKGLEQLTGTDRAYAGVLAGVRKDLGRDIDFSKQSDREAIGNALINHVRQTGGCDINGKKQPGC